MKLNAVSPHVSELSGPLFISLFKMYDFLLIKKNLSPSKVLVHTIKI